MSCGSGGSRSGWYESLRALTPVLAVLLALCGASATAAGAPSDDPAHYYVRKDFRRVEKIDAERNLLFVRGAIPGSKNGIVTVAPQRGKSRHD